MRLHKFLAQAGLGSRRQCEEYILAGRVRVNQTLITELGVQIVPTSDQVCFDGKPVAAPQTFVYLLLNKPEGYLVTRVDTHARQTIYDLLPPDLHYLHPVGRLDKESCGLLLLTNHGELTQKLNHPSHKVTKVYEVWVTGKVSSKVLKRLNRPMTLGEDFVSSHRVELTARLPEQTRLIFYLKEGKNRQIRRMCQQVGLQVVFLQRTAIGHLQLAPLSPGEYRLLSQAEVLPFYAK